MSFFMLASISAWVSPPDTMPSFGGSLHLAFDILLDTWASDSGLSVDTAFSCSLRVEFDCTQTDSVFLPKKGLLPFVVSNINMIQ